MKTKTIAFLALFLFGFVCFSHIPTQAGSTSSIPLPATIQEPNTMQWESVSAGLESPFALWFSPAYASDGQLYAVMDHTLWEVGLGYGAIYRTDNGGVSWLITSPTTRQMELAAFVPTGSSEVLILAVEIYYNESFEPVNRLVRSTTGGDTWDTVWDDCPLFSALVFSPDFTNDQTVFAVWANSASGGLWKSIDGGVTWYADQRIQVHPDNGKVVSLVFSPQYASDHTLLASVPPHTDGGVTYPGGVYRSEDYGSTWTASQDGCLGAVNKLEYSPNSAVDHIVYAIGNDSSDIDNGRVYRSNDSGHNWSCLAAQPLSGAIFDLALSPGFGSDQTVVLATQNGLVHSLDDGANWSAFAWTGAQVQRVYLSPAFSSDQTLGVALLSGQVEAAYPGGDFLSYDGGTTWQAAGIARSQIKTLALSPDYFTNTSLWAASGDGYWTAYRSTDNAQTWLQQYSYNMGDYVGFNGMAALPLAGGGHEVYATTQLGAWFAGVYKSIDNGATFGLLGGSPQYGNTIVLSKSSFNELTLWVGNYQGLYQSTNGGLAWTLSNGDLPAGTVVSLVTLPLGIGAEDDLFYVVLTGANAGVYCSTDGTAHWSALPLPDGAVAQQVSLSPEYDDDQTVWVSSAADGIFRSDDAGQTWQAPITVLSGCGAVQVTGEGATRQLWAACSGSLYSSADEGATWTITGPTGLNILTVVSSPQMETIFLGTTDGGGIWRGRPDYSIVQVLDEASAPVSQAQVFRNGALVGETSSEGILKIPLSSGDQIVARKLLKTWDSPRSYHDVGQLTAWTYHLYITSLDIPVEGEPTPAVVSNPAEIQTLTVRKANTLVGFNIVASVEWDASAQYLEELRQGFENASAYLYDVTDGQMLFERITIYDNNEAMSSADAQVRLDNQNWPHAYVGGLLLRPERGAGGKYFWVGPYFDSFSSREGAWNLPVAYKALVHEFGHYGLELWDSYLRYGATGSPYAADCTGPEIHTNQTPDINATIMDDPYNTSELSMKDVPGLWSDNCLTTAQYELNHQSDWETVVAVYESTAPELWTIKTPALVDQVIAGPHGIPVSDWSQAVIGGDAHSGVCDPSPVFQAVKPTGEPRGLTAITLDHNGRLISLGVTDNNGYITLLGASAGDEVNFTYCLGLLAADKAMSDSEGCYIATSVVSCTTSQNQAMLNGTALTTSPIKIVLEPAAFNINIQISPSDTPNPLQAKLAVKASTALAATPQVTMTQVGADSSISIPMSFDPGSQAYLGVIPLVDGLPTEGLVMVEAVDLLSNTVHSPSNFHLETVIPDTYQDFYSSDGQAWLFVPANTLEGEGQITLQKQFLEAPAPDNLELIGGPYALQASPTLTEVDLNPDISSASLSLYYLNPQSGHMLIDFSSLKIYAWDGSQWTALESSANTNQPIVSTPVKIEGKVYALFGHWLQQVYIPLVKK
jgi:hypothetical protein